MREIEKESDNKQAENERGMNVRRKREHTEKKNGISDDNDAKKNDAQKSTCARRLERSNADRSCFYSQFISFLVTLPPFCLLFLTRTPSPGKDRERVREEE